LPNTGYRSRRANGRLQQSSIHDVDDSWHAQTSTSLHLSSASKASDDHSLGSAGRPVPRFASHATEHAAELDRQILQRLLALPGEPWLDICGDEIYGEDS
jgi:hypothetical protein